MLKTIVFAVLLSATSGCLGYTIPIAGEGYDGPTNPQPGQTLATAIVWNQVLGGNGGQPPPIVWHFGDNCVDTDGSKWGAKYGTTAAFKDAHSDDCLLGQYEPSGWVETTEYDAPNRIDVEWNGAFSSQQSFAHELCHAYRQYMTGDADDNHTSPCFVGADGKPYSGIGDTGPGSLVYQANAALLAAGF